MRKYLFRLDDACERMDIAKWERIELLFDKYNIKPIVGIIPHCEDAAMEKYEENPLFWDKAKKWADKKWIIAMHGYNHVYSTTCGGINPVNKRSEFAGEPLEIQKEKIRKALEIFQNHGIDPIVFFAPSHTFDINTLKALELESSIRIISDTIACNAYKRGGFVFLPQQSGKTRRLPFKFVTFCLHPNTMGENDFRELEAFIRVNYKFIVDVVVFETNRKYSLFDRLLNFAYMLRHK